MGLRLRGYTWLPIWRHLTFHKITNSDLMWSSGKKRSIEFQIAELLWHSKYGGMWLHSNPGCFKNEVFTHFRLDLTTTHVTISVEKLTG